MTAIFEASLGIEVELASAQGTMGLELEPTSQRG